MNLSLSVILQRVLEAAWRRRLLIALPLTIMLPLGLVYAKFAPKTYVAKSLMLLQESGREYPFAPDPVGPGRMQDRILGLRALIKSDLVLFSVMGDIAGPAAPTDPNAIATWIRDFSNALTLDNLGNDFLQFQLKGTTPKGLGRQLEAVTSRFIEALLTTDETLSATQVLLDRRKEEFDAAQRAFDRFKAQIAARLPPTYQEDVQQLSTLSQRLSETTRELSLAGHELESIRGQPARGPGLRGPTEANGQPGEGINTQPGESTEIKTASLAPADIATVTQKEARYKALQAEVEKLSQSVNAAKRAVGHYGVAAQQLQTLQAAVDKARDEYQSYAKRYSNLPTSGRMQGIIKAPERIKLIDPPRDPEFPENSALKLAIAAVVMSVLTAVGLALLAELLDPTIRRPEELEELTGAPVLARLPHSSASPT